MKEIFLAVLLIFSVSYLTLIEKEAEQNQELRQIEIIKQAENSNDPILKQKAERIKAEIQEKELKIQLEKIESEKQKEKVTAIEKEIKSSGILSTALLAFGIMLFLFIYHKFFMSKPYKD